MSDVSLLSVLGKRPRPGTPEPRQTIGHLNRFEQIGWLELVNPGPQIDIAATYIYEDWSNNLLTAGALTAIERIQRWWRRAHPALEQADSPGSGGSSGLPPPRGGCPTCGHAPELTDYVGEVYADDWECGNDGHCGNRDHENGTF